MSIQWENYKSIGLKHSSRWGHCSATLPNNHLVLFGGYVDSKFLRDVWVFNPVKNSWSQVQFSDTHQKPVQRSNCSFFYCDIFKGIIMFGGGSHQNAKLNDLWCLKIQENKQYKEKIVYQGEWSELYPQNTKVPWGRTYHVSEFFANFLLIHGGQSYAGEIQDLWVLNLIDLKWVQLKTTHKQQARKFHTSAIVKQRLYIFGGIHENYQPINKISYVDLSVLRSQDLQAIEDHNFQWRQVDLSGPASNIIGRWGHVSKVFEDNVYIFGGRTVVQQNDLLIFNTKSHSLHKIAIQKVPQGRRKPCVWLIGSLFIINSGYNGNYLSDQQWIDLRFIKEQMKISQLQASSIIQKKELCDIHINTSDNKYIDMYSKFIRNSFQNEDDMILMMQQLAQMKYEAAVQYAQILKTGVYISENESDQNIDELIYSNGRIPDVGKYDFVNERILRKYKITYSANELLANKKKILFNVVKQNTVMNLNPFKLIRVSEKQFNKIFKRIQEDCCCDINIVFSSTKTTKSYQLSKQFIRCCKYPLIFRSDYFKNVIQNSELRRIDKRWQQLIVQMNSDYNNIKLMKIIVLYCYYGHVIISKQFTLSECLSLYKLVKKFSILPMMSICFGQIKDLIYGRQFDDWINGRLTKNKNKKQQKQFNPQKNNLLNNQSINNQVKQIINDEQFEQIVQFCISEIKCDRKTQRKVTKINCRVDNRWEQLIFYIINRLSQLSVKKYVNSALQIKLQESRISKINKKIHLQNNKKINTENKLNIRNKQNCQNKQNINISNINLSSITLKSNNSSIFNQSNINNSLNKSNEFLVQSMIFENKSHRLEVIENKQFIRSQQNKQFIKNKQNQQINKNKQNKQYKYFNIIEKLIQTHIIIPLTTNNLSRSKLNQPFIQTNKQIIKQKKNLKNKQKLSIIKNNQIQLFFYNSIIQQLQSSQFKFKLLISQLKLNS